MAEIKVSEWVENYDKGMYDSSDRKTQIEAGWYDWFCDDDELSHYLKNELAPKVKELVKSPKINTDTMYVWFKNNCPMDGELYNDIRFADIKTGDTLFTVIPSSGHTSIQGRAEAWSYENDFKEPVVTGNWYDILQYFKIK